MYINISCGSQNVKNKDFEFTYKGFPLTPVFIFAGRPVPLHVSRCQPLPGSSRVSPGCTGRISVIARGGGGVGE